MKTKNYMDYNFTSDLFGLEVYDWSESFFNVYSRNVTPYYEYVVSINSSTRTRDVISCFLKEDSNGNYIYKRMVLKKGLPGNYYYHLVVERSENRYLYKNMIGSITFTEYKQLYLKDLYDYIREEVTKDIAKEYVDRNQYYRFTKPYRLCAQRNRYSYQYGDTDDYFFVGVYISSYYLYAPFFRKPFSANSLNTYDFRDRNRLMKLEKPNRQE